MNILITGGLGFIGSNIAKYFIKHNHNVTVTTHTRSSMWRLLPYFDSVNVIDLDITNSAETVEKLRTTDPDIIIHNVAFGIYHEKDQEKVFDTNIFGTLNMVNAYMKTRSNLLINTSSVSEYGISKKEFEEDDRIKPLGDYGVSKASATLFCESAHELTGKKIITTRISNAYGPNERPQDIIPYLLVNKIRDKEVRLNSPSNTRDFIFIDDVAEAYGKIVFAYEQINTSILNIATGIGTSIEKLVEIINGIDPNSNKIKAVWNSNDPRVIDKAAYYSVSTKRVNNDLKWRPSYSIKDGIKKFYLWMAEINAGEQNEIKDTYFASVKKG
jgi:nucleoside-diphosphate-sugar epimerase